MLFGKKAILLFTVLMFLLSACGNAQAPDHTGSSLQKETDAAASYIHVEQTIVPEPSQEKASPLTESQKGTNFQILTAKSVYRIEFAIYAEGIFTIHNGYYGENANKYGFMRSDGTEITEYIYDYTYPFSEGLACVRKDGKYGFIDRNGSISIPLIYDNATPFVEGLAYFEKNDDYGFINHNGEPVFQLDCDSISSFQEGLAFFSVDGKYGYVDTSGSVTIAPIFDDAGFFKNGLAKVRVDHAFGMIDKTGTFVVAPLYDDVTVDGEYFRINDYCFEWAFGIDNCYVANIGYGFGSDSIVIIGDIEETDLSYLLLRNEITPRVKPFSHFLREGFIEHDSFDNESAVNGFIQFYKLYNIGDNRSIMYYYTRPLRQDGMAMSYSGFFSMKDGRLVTLVTGYECGGSMGGDFVCFWQDNRTPEVYVGTSYHHGGFGGHAYGGNIYNLKNGDAVPIVSFGLIDQTLRNYDENDLLENAYLLYDADGIPYTKDSILQAAEDYNSATEYLVDGKQVTIEKFREITNRYSVLYLWPWKGY